MKIHEKRGRTARIVRLRLFIYDGYLSTKIYLIVMIAQIKEKYDQQKSIFCKFLVSLMVKLNKQ
jgi:hypothetical protein